MFASMVISSGVLRRGLRRERKSDVQTFKRKVVTEMWASSQEGREKLSVVK